MEKRQPGIDLVRSVAFLFVVGVHFNLYNGFYYALHEGPAMVAAESFRWLFFSCNGLYMTLTGYLISTKPWSRRYYKSLIPVLLTYVLTSAVSIPVRAFCFREAFTFWEWAEKFMSFAADYYGWYIKMYVGLLLISPILNRAMEGMEKRGLLAMLGTMLFLTALPSATTLTFAPNYWVSLYPLTFYVLGAVIRRLQPRPKPIFCLLMAVLTAFALGLINYFCCLGEKYENRIGQDYGGFWITLIVAAVFLGLYRLQPGPKAQKLLRFLASGSLGGYLMSHLLEAWVYKTFSFSHTPALYPIAFLTLTVPIFFLSAVLGNLIRVLVNRMTARLFPAHARS